MIRKTKPEEIQTIIKNSAYEEEDFETVERIVRVFEKYNLDTGVCHNF